MGKKEVRFFSVFCSRGDVPKRRCFAKFFYSLTSSFVVVCPPGGSFYFFSLSLLFERLHRERERERIGKRNTTFFPPLPSALFFFAGRFCCLSANSAPKLTTSGYTPYGLSSHYLISLSLFFLFLLTHFISFSLSFIKNNDNKTTTDRSKRD